MSATDAAAWAALEYEPLKRRLTAQGRFDPDLYHAGLVELLERGGCADPELAVRESMRRGVSREIRRSITFPRAGDALWRTLADTAGDDADTAGDDAEETAKCAKERLLRRVRRAMEQGLNREESEMVTLRFIHGMTYHALGAYSGTAESAAYKRVNKIIEKIKKMVST